MLLGLQSPLHAREVVRRRDERNVSGGKTSVSYKMHPGTETSAKHAREALDGVSKPVGRSQRARTPRRATHRNETRTPRPRLRSPRCTAQDGSCTAKSPVRSQRQPPRVLSSAQDARTSNIATARFESALSYSPARASASTHHSVQRQNVPSSPPTPSSVFETSYR